MGQLTSQQVMELKEKYSKFPLEFNKDFFGGTIWGRQQEVWESVWKNRKTAVKSGHATGKSYIVAKIICSFLATFGPRAKVITTAPTFTQVEKIVWREIANIYNNCKRPLGGRLNKTELFFSEEWFGVGISTDEADRFAGFHSPHILVIFDEASGIQGKIWEAAKGLMTGENSKWLVIGNPLSPTGEFYNCFSKDSEWNKITISSLETPNYVAGKDVIPGLASRAWAQECLREWGEDSPLYFSKVLGLFPVEAADTLIPLTWAELARTRIIDLEPTGLGLGADIARYGDNETVLTLFDGYKVIRKERYKKRGTTEITGLIIDMLRDSGDINTPVAVDDTGLGGGVSDMLMEQRYNVIPVVLRARADDENKFFDLRSEILWHLREKFKNGTICTEPNPAQPEDDKMTSQLVSLKYEMDRKGRIKIQPKETLRKQGASGSDSPDRADSLALAVYAATGVIRRGFHRVPETINMMSQCGAGGY